MPCPGRAALKDPPGSARLQPDRCRACTTQAGCQGLRAAGLAGRAEAPDGAGDARAGEQSRRVRAAAARRLRGPGAAEGSGARINRCDAGLTALLALPLCAAHQACTRCAKPALTAAVPRPLRRPAGAAQRLHRADPPDLAKAGRKPPGRAAPGPVAAAAGARGPVQELLQVRCAAPHGWCAAGTAQAPALPSLHRVAPVLFGV